MGFFFCTGHGMSAAMIDKAIQAARDLFNLDERQKLVGS